MTQDNFVESLKYAVKLRDEQEVLHDVDGKKYYDRDKGQLVELHPIKYAETLVVRTLTGLVGFLKERFDNPHEIEQSLLIHVKSPTEVQVLSALDVDRRRENLITAAASLEQFPYGRFQDSEKFIINVQSLIQRDLDAEAILQCAASIRIEGGADLKDDGISQTVTAKIGAGTVGAAEVPNPAELRPYRTFLEVEQPSSTFVFRINKDGDCALFEADGGIWKHTAMANIKEFLMDSLIEEIEAGYLSVIA